MAKTTITSFYSTLQSMSVTGVTKAHTEPQLYVKTVHVPAMWVDDCGLDCEGIRAKKSSGKRNLRARVCVLMEPMGQDLQSNRWTDAKTMVGSLDDALETAFGGNPNARWSIDIDPNLDGSGQMAVTAAVQSEEFK